MGGWQKIEIAEIKLNCGVDGCTARLNDRYCEMTSENALCLSYNNNQTSSRYGSSSSGEFFFLLKLSIWDTEISYLE